MGLKKDAKTLFICGVLCLSMAMGLSSSVFSNYFKEVFAIDSVQRGLLEIPREMPGVLCVVVLTALAGMGNLNLAVLAYGLSTVGLAVLGLLSPSYAVMQVFLFLFSLGEHMMMPLRDVIAMEMVQDGKTGTFLGQLKGKMTLASMAASVIVFLGYRLGFFWFDDGVIPSFVLGLVFVAAGFGFMAALRVFHPELNVVQKPSEKKKEKLHIKRKYVPYYIVTAVYGCQKRMRIVFAPWLIVELLMMGADTLALLGIAAYFIGSQIAPLIGRMLDRYGVPVSLTVEAVFFAGAFLVGALASWGIVSGNGVFGSRVVCAGLAFLSYILILLTDYFNTVHTVLMKKLSDAPEDVMGNLSLGLSVDHVIAVTVSGLFGLVWKAWGPQYVFILGAAASIVHVGVAGYLARTKVSS